MNYCVLTILLVYDIFDVQTVSTRTNRSPKYFLHEVYMRILVNIKCVPDTMEVVFKTTEHVLDRNRMPFTMNPFDLYALEAAARIKESGSDVRVTALCMGTETSKSVLRDAIAICADEAVLIRDDQLTGADAGLTAQVLAQAIKRLEEEQGAFDLILNGFKSTDGGTATVPAMIAARLDRSFLASCLSVTEESADTFRVMQDMEQDDRLMEVTTPCVLSFTKAAFDVRYPDIARILAAGRMDIRCLQVSDLFHEEALVRTAAVRSLKLRPVKKSGRVIKGGADTVSDKLLRILSEKGLFSA